MAVTLSSPPCSAASESHRDPGVSGTACFSPSASQTLRCISSYTPPSPDENHIFILVEAQFQNQAPNTYNFFCFNCDVDLIPYHLQLVSLKLYWRVLKFFSKYSWISEDSYCTTTSA